MNCHNRLRLSSLFIGTLLLAISCNGPSKSKDETPSETLFEQSADNSTLHEDKSDSAVLVKRYTRALTDYIAVVDTMWKIRLDSIFLGDRKFGTEDDFPNIVLPPKIKSASIQLLSVGEGHRKKDFAYTVNSPFVNLMAWKNKDEMEFDFVSFYPGFDHQFDCFLYYHVSENPTKDSLTGWRVEQLIRDKNGSPLHTAVYVNGTFSENKPVKQP